VTLKSMGGVGSKTICVVRNIQLRVMCFFFLCSGWWANPTHHEFYLR